MCILHLFLLAFTANLITWKRVHTVYFLVTCTTLQTSVHWYSNKHHGKAGLLKENKHTEHPNHVQGTGFPNWFFLTLIFSSAAWKYHCMLSPVPPLICHTLFYLRLLIISSVNIHCCCSLLLLLHLFISVPVLGIVPVGSEWCWATEHLHHGSLSASLGKRCIWRQPWGHERWMSSVCWLWEIPVNSIQANGSRPRRVKAGSSVQGHAVEPWRSERHSYHVGWVVLCALTSQDLIYFSSNKYRYKVQKYVLWDYSQSSAHLLH